VRLSLQPFADDPCTLLTVARPGLREDVVDNVIALNAKRGLNELGGMIAVIRVDSLLKQVGHGVYSPLMT
jgi:hypothetical protein